MAVVRPEFRIDILVPQPGALIFQRRALPGSGCLRMPWTRKLCRGHYATGGNRTDARTWRSSRPRPAPELLGRKELTGCVVAGCRFGGARRGLLVRHHGFWERAGKPGRPAWLASLPAVADEGRAVCLLSFCTLWRQGNSPFCVGHKSRWEFAGRPGIDEFIVICESKGNNRSTSARWPAAGSSSWSFSTPCNAATMSATSTPQAGLSVAPSPWPRPAASRPCWTRRPGAGRRSSTRT